MTFEIEGALHKKFDIENKSGSFQAREFVISTDGAYPQFVKFQLTQDKCSVIDNYNEGERVKVSFDLRGREWQGKYFTNLNAWRVDKVQVNNAISEGSNMPPPPPSFDEGSDFSSGLPQDFDDLPF